MTALTGVPSYSHICTAVDRTPLNLSWPQSGQDYQTQHPQQRSGLWQTVHSWLLAAVHTGLLSAFTLTDIITNQAGVDSPGIVLQSVLEVGGSLYSHLLRGWSLLPPPGQCYNNITHSLISPHQQIFHMKYDIQYYLLMSSVALLQQSSNKTVYYCIFLQSFLRYVVTC